MTCRKSEAIATARRIGAGSQQSAGEARRWQSSGKAGSQVLCAISESAPDRCSLRRGGGLDGALNFAAPTSTQRGCS
jgi:hypothetical protein